MQTIFITGATKGIGRESALLFARKGFKVFGCGRDQNNIDELNALAKKENLALEIFRMDVTSQTEIDRGMARLMEATENRGVDILVNNAGYQELGPVEDLSLDIWRAQFETNVFAMIEMVRRLAPMMRERKQGRIINLASIAGLISFPIYGAYAASKHAIEGMSDSLRMELKQFGIKVVIIEPGPMISNINFTGFDNLAKHRPLRTAYSTYYAAGPAMLDRLEKNSWPTILAAEQIFKAATVSRPKQRYGVSRTWYAVKFAEKLLPGWLQDFMLGRL